MGWLLRLIFICLLRVCVVFFVCGISIVVFLGVVCLCIGVILIIIMIMFLVDEFGWIILGIFVECIICLSILIFWMCIVGLFIRSEMVVLFGIVCLGVIILICCFGV